MSILVLQTKIGENDFSDFNLTEFYEFEKNICMPSVKNWANKCGYDYKLIEASTVRCKDNFFNREQKKYASERYMHVRTTYDYVIYVDTDVLATSHANKFPVFDGVTAAEEFINMEHFYNANDYSQEFINQAKKLYVNSGVFSVDNATGLILNGYFLKRFKHHKNQNTDAVGDQDMFNSFIFENNVNFQILPSEWNVIVKDFFIEEIHDPSLSYDERYAFVDNDQIKIENYNFIHFSGYSKKYFKEILHSIGGEKYLK